MDKETLKRILMGVPFAMLFFGSLLLEKFDGLIFAILTTFIGSLMLWEWSEMFRSKKLFLPSLTMQIFYLLISLATFFSPHYFKYSVIVFTLFITIALIPRLRNPQFNDSFLEITLGLIGLVYFGIFWNTLIPFKNLHFDTKSSPQIHLILVIATTWACDIGAYFIGRFWSKKSLNICVSPNKTVGGLIGGILTSYLVLALFILWQQDLFFLIALPIPFLTILADLFESLAKRFGEVKDSSNLIPGHGGIFDVFDALCITVPFYYYLYILLAL